MGEKAPKYSDVNFSFSIFNPTDINFNNLYVNLFVNSESTYSRASISLPSNNTEIANVTWVASKEGPLSLIIKSIIIDYNDNSTDDYIITLNRFVEIETEDAFSKSDGSWTGLLAIFIILSICSYIIFTGMEDQVSESVESEDEEVSQDEDKREMAITNESSEDE